MLIEIRCEVCGSEHYAPTTCVQCGEIFQPVRRWQKYCDDECRKDVHLHRYHLRKKDAPQRNGFVRRI
jgi:hypothetical protein